MPGGELEPIGPSSPRLTEVSGDMSEIFARVGVREPAGGPRRPAVVSALRPEPARGRTLTWLAAATTGLAGLAVGAFVIHVSPPSPPPAPAIANPPAQATTLALASPASSPAASSPLPTVAAAAAVPPVREPVQIAPATRAPVRAKAAVKARAPELAMAQPASCERNAVGAPCRRAVVQADRHLRDVYQRAVRRGVPHAVLVDYRDRWADLRDSETDDPSRLIRSYGALAYDLGRESRTNADGPRRRRNPSGLGALADALLPWR